MHYTLQTRSLRTILPLNIASALTSLSSPPCQGSLFRPSLLVSSNDTLQNVTLCTIHTQLLSTVCLRRTARALWIYLGSKLPEASIMLSPFLKLRKREAGNWIKSVPLEFFFCIKYSLESHSLPTPRFILLNLDWKDRQLVTSLGSRNTSVYWFKGRVSYYF